MNAEAGRRYVAGVVMLLLSGMSFPSLSASSRSDFDILVKVDPSNVEASTVLNNRAEQLRWRSPVRSIEPVPLFDTAYCQPSSVGGVFRIVISAGSLREALDAFSGQPGIVYAEENALVRALFTPNDPSYSSQWHFSKVNLGTAWDFDATEPLYGGDPSVVVAVIDTGIAYENYVDGSTTYQQAPDFAQTTFTAGYDFINGDTHPNDDNGHGTHVAATIAESTNNGVSAAGIAFRSTVMPVKVLGDDGLGAISEVASGIDFATANGADVINLSLGSSSPSQTLADAIERALAAGKVVVAAAGNDAQSSIAYPAAYSGVIGVSALGPDDVLASYSNYGTGVALSAPGGDDGQYVLQQGYSNLDGGGHPLDFTTFGLVGYQGTSQATPHVSGAAALLLARGAPAAGVQTLLQTAASDLGPAGYDTQYGHGRLNISQALSLFVNDQVAPVTALTQSPASPDGQSGYYITPPSITLSASDTGGSGVASLWYQWDSGTVTRYTGTLTPPEGSHTLRYYAVDAAGNTETAQQASYAVDSVAPVVNLSRPGATINNQVVAVVGTITDATSGVGTLTLNGTTVGIGTDGSFSTQVRLPLGKNTLRFVATDIAGTTGTPSQEVVVTAKERIIVGTLTGGPQVVVYTEKGGTVTNFFAFQKTLRTGVRVSTADVDANGNDEVITASGIGKRAEVRVYAKTSQLQKKFFAFPATYLGGINIAGGDLDGDGDDEIIVAPRQGGGPTVRVFSGSGVLVLQFNAFAKTYRGGVRVAAGDLDGDGKAEVIVAEESGGKGLVKVFTPKGKFVREFQGLGKSFQGAASVSAGDLTGDGKAEIVVAGGLNADPVVRVFTAKGKLQRQFLAYTKTFRGGVDLAVGDITGDNVKDIVTGPGGGAAARVKAFTFNGTILRQFSVYTKSYRGGITIATGLTD